MLYGDKLRSDGYEAERFPGDQVAPSTIQATARKWYFKHLSWMTGETIRFTEELEIEKAMRWLGFIQGAFWVLGYRTIAEMREDNRMPESGEPKASRCIGCRIEAEIGTEENPHPVPGRFHTCPSLEGSS